MAEPLRVLVVAEHASARFGGEAALPLHYFRVMARRGLPVWLVTHARTRPELEALYPGDPRIAYVEDTALHRALWKFGRHLPDAISYPTTGFASRLATQWTARRLARRLVREHRIDVIHQPMPVSPREPSLLHGLGVPVLIGPMNGAMDYPPAFQRRRSAAERLLIGLGRASSSMLNRLVPGKRRAAALLVANQRTREALPPGTGSHVVELVENGVDLGLWHAASTPPFDASAIPVTTFAFMGRLVDWKAVDLAVQAFAQARALAPMRLWILGDGAEREHLETLASDLGIPFDASALGAIHFAGWLAQAECAARLHEADALLLPSLLECGGAVVLEAMSLAKPVIATAWGGPLDYLDAECGVLIEPASRQAIVTGFADAMVELACSPELRARLGARGQDKVRREFDWEIKVDRMLEVYAECLRRADPARVLPHPDTRKRPLTGR